MLAFGVLTVTLDTAAVEAFLRRAPYLHNYELGDLDPREASHVTWIASEPIDAVALLYTGLAIPTVLALADGNQAALHRLLVRNAEALPARFYAHLSPGLESALAPRFGAEPLGLHYKMGLDAPLAEDADADAGAVRLTSRDADEVVAFYAASYPTGYFEPVNLERGPYVAVRDDRGIVAIAGVHVYSPTVRVASLGNVATRPNARGRGHARRATAALCRLLAREVDLISLNVLADNPAAIACYRRLGFSVRHEFNEWRMTAA